MEDSILTGTKLILGIADSYTAFDHEILTHINTALSSLTQLGVGPDEGFMIEDSSPVWDDFIGDDPRFNEVKSLVFLKVKMLFDPPGTSYHIEAMNNQIRELEFRVSITREGDKIEEEAVS